MGGAGMNEADQADTRRVDTRSTLALIIVSNIVILTAFLAYTAPDSDAFKILLGLLGGSATAVIGYYYGSNSTTERKDQAQERVAARLADKVATPEAVTKFAWWSLFTDDEKRMFEIAAQTDGRVKMFIVVAQVGRAEEQDLDYLVQVGALTKERADFIRAS
jgi:hypothetical protein